MLEWVSYNRCDGVWPIYLNPIRHYTYGREHPDQLTATLLLMIWLDKPKQHLGFSFSLEQVAMLPQPEPTQIQTLNEHTQ